MVFDLSLITLKVCGVQYTYPNLGGSPLKVASPFVGTGMKLELCR